MEDEEYRRLNAHIALLEKRQAEFERRILERIERLCGVTPELSSTSRAVQVGEVSYRRDKR